MQSYDDSDIRPRLENLWRRTVDRIVVLSQAYFDENGLLPDEAPLAGPGPDDGPIAAGTPGLMRRLMAEHQMLADVEEALDRLAADRYGLCERCGDPMPPAWLAEWPQVRGCPDCSLAEVRWQRRGTVPTPLPRRPGAQQPVRLPEPRLVRQPVG